MCLLRLLQSAKVPPNDSFLLIEQVGDVGFRVESGKESTEKCGAVRLFIKAIVMRASV